MSIFKNYYFHKSAKKLRSCKMRIIIISKLLNWASAVGQNYYSSIYGLPNGAPVWGHSSLVKSANITVVKMF